MQRFSEYRTPNRMNRFLREPLSVCIITTCNQSLQSEFTIRTHNHTHYQNPLSAPPPRTNTYAQDPVFREHWPSLWYQNSQL